MESLFHLPFAFAVRLGDGHVDGRGHDVFAVRRLGIAVDVVEIVVDGGCHLRVGVFRISTIRGELHPDDQGVGLAGEGHRAGILEAVQGVVAVPVGIVVILLAGGRRPAGMDAAGRQVALGVDAPDPPGPNAAGIRPLGSRTLVRGPFDLAVGAGIGRAGPGSVGGLEGVEVVGQVRPVEGPGLEISVGDLGAVLRLRGPGEEDRRCKEGKGLSHRAQSCWLVGSATSAAS